MGEGDLTPEDPAMTDMPAVPSPAPPRTGADVRSLLELVVRASGACEALLARHGPPLTVAQWAALDALVQTDARRPFQIARKLRTTRQRAWQIARGLEAAGYVTMTGGAEGEGTTLTVTEAGLAAFQGFDAAIFDPVAAQMTEARPDAALGGTRAVLRSLVDAFEALSEKEPHGT
jgi:DNA-binding MarR family transcriptional regulator